MIFFKRSWKVLLFWCLASASWAGVSPITFTFFGLYGQPVSPSVLANSTPDAFGFNALLEWNATPYTSFGFSYEQATFYNSPNFTIPMVNFETRLFPLENEKEWFSPYVYGGVGLNLAAASAWQGPVQLKAGIGSRVDLVGPIFFDIAAGSHWLQPPNNFQYVDFRAGVGMSFWFKERSQSTKPASNSPASTTVKVPTPFPTTLPTATVVSTPGVNWTPIPTPIYEIPQAPVTTLAQVKKYYKLGMRAFLDRNYALSLKLLTKSLASKEIHGAAYYYAETYATIGVIYQFHAHKVKDHDQKALINYRKALAIDPHTKSAKTYYKKLQAKVAKEAAKKKRLKSKPTPVPEGITMDGTSASSDSAAPPRSSEKGVSVTETPITK